MEEHVVERLGHLGDGIAPGPVYVARTLPGERVEGAVEGDRIAAPRILTPSPDRVRPPCAHYRTCGGCAVMHARDGFVAGWKQEIVRQALAAHDVSAPFRPIATSPPRSRRRASLSARRTKGGAVIGFHGRASGTITPVPECHVLSDGLRAALPVVEALTRLGASRKGEMTFTLLETETGVDVSATSGKPRDRSLDTLLAAAVQDTGVARLTWNGETALMASRPVLHFGMAPVTPPPGAFLQATAAGEAALRDAVAETVGAGRHVADLFAGCGTFALPLAAVMDVLAVEGARELTGALEAGWRAAGGLRPLRAVTRDLFRDPLRAEELRSYDAIVIDPPRAGAAAQMAQIARSGVPRVASLSCNPVTFARDAATLVGGGYALDWVQVVDQFRWSAHVEIAAMFRRP